MESKCANVCRSDQLRGTLVYTSCEWSRLGSYLEVGLDGLGRGLKRSQPMGPSTTGGQPVSESRRMREE
jgi:hypothetical protein